MAAKPSESTRHAYTYIPPSVQQSMAQHMQRAMPGHLQKYQQSGGYVPVHAQKAMTQQMQKNLPSHLQKYVDPYMHQNVFHPGSGGTASAALASPAPSVKPSNIYGRPSSLQQSFSPSETGQPQQTPGAPPNPPDSSGSNPYDFIMNPQKPDRQPLFFGGGSMKQRILVLAAGFLILIILMVIVSNLLSGAGNSQRDRLMGLATTETEIARVSDAAKLKITDKDLANLSVTIKLSALSTKQEVISALGNRGVKKVKEKQIAVKDPANDAALTEGEDNGRFDDTYRQLLVKLLSNYQAQLEQVYDSGTTSEKNLATSANDQINLLLKKLKSNQD